MRTSLPKVENLENFLEKNKNKLVGILFTAPWCRTCQGVYPLMEKLQEEFKKEIILSLLDIGEDQKYSVNLKILSIPQVRFYFNCEEKGRILGLKKYKEYKEIVKKILDSIRT